MSQEEAAAAATQATTQAPAQAPAQAEPTPAAPATPAFRSPENLAKLLVADDAPAKAPEPAPAPAAVTPEPEKPAPTPAATPEPAEQRPGTPDKVIQQLQQDHAATSRKLDELLSKVTAGQTLTAKETQQVEQAKRKLDGLREKLTTGSFDTLNHGQEVAASVVELDQQSKTLAEQLAATQARLDAVEQRARQSEATTDQASLQGMYPKVDIDGVFKNALADAAKLTGIDPERTPAGSDLGRVLANAANSIFHDRASAAAKSVAGKEKPAAAAPAPAPVKPAAPVTPNGARFSNQTSGAVTNNAPTSDWRAQYIERARALVKD